MRLHALAAHAVVLALLLGASPASADCTTTPTLCGLTVTSTIEEPDYDEAIDVVLVGDGFTDAASWTAVANSAIATFRSHTNTGLYGSVPGLYNFHVVQVLSATNDVSDTDLTDTALGMRVSGATITSDSSRVMTAALNAPDVDVTIALANGSGRANANYPTSLASGGAVRMGTDMNPISHELGHAVIQLADEYVETALCSGRSESGAITQRNVTADATCLKFSTTAGAGCVEGAKYCATGMYRSAGSCLMSSSGNSTPCPVCQRAIRDVLLEKQNGLDRAEPWAVVTSPSPGATITGTTTFMASVYDDFFTPTRMSFVVDGVFRGAATITGTFASLPFDTATLADGSHILQVFPDDAAGHAGLGTRVTFTTQNFSVPAASTLSIFNPANGATVSGTAFIGAGATDPTPLWMALLVDGTALAIVSDSKNVSAQWNTSSATLGPHTIEVRGADHLGNLLAPQVITVSVAGAPVDGGTGGSGGVQSLSVYIQSPQPWSGVGPSFLLRYGVFGTSGAATPELYVDGAPVTPNPLPAIPAPAPGPAETPPQSVLINSSTWALGPHQVEVRVTSGSATARSQPLPLVRVAPGAAPVAFLRAPAPGAQLRGTVSVLASAYDDVAVSSLSLWVDGVSVASQAGSSATFPWNTGLLADGVHTLKVRATDSTSAYGDSETITVVVDNTAPAPQVLAPANGATVPASLMPVSVFSDGAFIELLVDGQPVASGSNTPLSLPVALTPGTHALRARGTDAAGNVGLSNTVTVTAGNCTAGGCNDGRACTTDSCSTSGACLFLPGANCCSTAADCNDGDACTTDACNAGTCTRTTVAGCCNYGQQCADGQACTTDVCSGAGGTCSHGAAGCCATATDCNDGNSCTVDTCLPNGQCAFDWQGACCRTSADCNDGNACTTEACNAGQCTITPVAGCCNSASDCDDGVACTWNQCINHACQFPPRIGCCTTAADCASLNTCVTTSCASNTCQSAPIANCCTFASECDDRDPCTQDTCAGGTCQRVPVCCTTNAQCNDGQACTTDTCVGGSCQFTAVPGCCTTAADCNDGNVCTTDACAAQACTNAAVPGCCRAAADCDDGDACTTDTCASNTCGHAPNPACCTTAAQCDDGNPCTTDTCAGNVCGHGAVAGCCTTAAMCGDGNACTTDACVNNVCTNVAVPQCCTSAAQCDDANACTADACTNNACTHTNSCCTAASECDDADACTVDTCAAGACGHARTANCCTSVAQCDDGDACTDEACTANACVVTPRANCCRTAAECDDGNTCTDDACTANACTHLASCCTTDQDCSDGDACTADRCEANGCVREAVAGCCSTAAQCDDGNACTTDSCTAASCSSTPIAGCCLSASDCAQGETCVNQACASTLPPTVTPEPVVGSCGCQAVDGASLWALAALGAWIRRRRQAGDRR